MTENNHNQAQKNHPTKAIKEERSTLFPIAPDLGKTDDYRTDDRAKNETPNSNSEYRWSHSHVGLALVKAVTKFHALALASTAFKRRKGSNKNPESYSLLYYFDSTSKTITSNWETDLPSAATYKSDQGKHLIEEALDKSDSDSSFSVSDELTVNTSILNTSDPKHYIYTEESKPISSKSDLPEINPTNDSQEEWWVIPALLYQRKRKTSGREIAFRECSQCGHSRHVHLKDKKPDYANEDHTWACLKCDQLTKSAPPRNLSYDREGERPPITKDEYTENDHFEDMMRKLEGEGKLDR